MSTTISARWGGSYGAETPVNFLNLAGARFLVKPLRVALLADLERRVDVDLDELVLRLTIERASRRSSRYGEMNAVMTITPASANSFATSPTRRMFSCAVLRARNPRLALRPWRMLSPSST